MIPTTLERVSSNTAEEINERIRYQTKRNIARYGSAGPRAIGRRLAELEREWDIERYVEAMAPSITLVGLLLGATVNRKWLLLPAFVQTFLLQHAIQGWCPPIPVLRRLGVRTQTEIDDERFALKALRGDFDGIGQRGAEGKRTRTNQALEAVRR